MVRIPVVEKIQCDTLLEIGEIYRTRLGHIPLGKTIRLLRKRLRMSQRTLAKRSKVPAQTVSRIESGKAVPSFRTIEKILKALFCDTALVPLPLYDLDQLVQQQIRRIAEKRVQYLKGTMALELQKPSDEIVRELIAKEEKELHASDKLDIWKEIL